MSAYKEISTGWPDNEKVRLLTRAEIKHLVNTNKWEKLGKVFNFVPVFHFDGNNFIDWRCVPQGLLDAIKLHPQQKFPSQLHKGVIENMNRVQKRNHLKALMLSGKWDEVEKLYHFKPLFIETPIGKHVIDWSHISWDVRHILQCVGKIKPTPYTLEGGIYDPKEKKKIPKTKSVLVSRHLRAPRLTLPERLPIRARLYEYQKGICHFCKQFIMLDKWNTDHLIPISRGGTNDEFNLRGTCGDCNSNKSSMTEAEFLNSEFLKQKLKKYEAANGGVHE